MSLSSLISGEDFDQPANANLAKTANFDGLPHPSLAKLAAIAVANGLETVSGLSCWWRLHFSGGGVLEVFSPSGNSYMSILEAYPEAESAEAFELVHTLPTALMTEAEEATIRAWLASIGERQQEIIDEVLAQCQISAEARGYYMGEAVMGEPSDQKSIPRV
ncbi:MAG: hypothetical protein FWG52_08215 [Proteobacteria bacterium]|nr:hypothetical protein [Pseudomonadota bacterium]